MTSSLQLLAEKTFQESIQTQQAVMQTLLPSLIEAAELMSLCLKNQGTIFAFGNGGSAADAQHFTAELIGRYEKERSPWPALSLTTDTSALTAIGNDYSFDEVFSRQIQGLGRKGDLALAISTSGNSPNVLRAVKKAKELGIKTVGLTGKNGGELRNSCDLSICVPSPRTARIQEAHIVILHCICEIIEQLT